MKKPLAVSQGIIPLSQPEFGMQTRYGATPVEWERLTIAAGYQNILPTVCNPAAIIAPTSALKKAGKVPCVYRRDGLVTGIHQWQKKLSTLEEIQRWSNTPDYGICIQTRSVAAIDVDITDYGLAEIIKGYFTGLNYRYRNDSSKFLVPFVVPEAGWKKDIIQTEHGRIELLIGPGLQWLAAGTHENGHRYEWLNGVPEYFHHMSIKEATALWTALEKFGTTNTQPIRTTRTEERGYRDDVAAFIINSYDGFIKEDGNKLHIECPWMINHSSDTGIGQTSYLLPGSSGFDRGTFKCFHASCQNRTQNDFLIAIGYPITNVECAPLPATVAVNIPTLKVPLLQDWSRDGKGNVTPSVFNTCMALQMPSVYGFNYRFNSFSSQIYRDDRKITDSDITEVQLVLEGIENGIRIPKIARETARHAVALVANAKQYDPLQEYVAGLKWDGVPRVCSFLQTIFGISATPDQTEEYIIAVNRYIWTTLAGRALSPGEKADMIPVIIGSPGAMKTTKTLLIPPDAEWAGTIDLSMDDDKLTRLTRGKCVVQIDELSGLAGKDSARVNSWVTRAYDEMRQLYMEHTIRVPRRWLCIGTANPGEFLDGSAASRRWLPVTGAYYIHGADALLVATRDQLWAEGATIFQQSGIAYADADRLADLARRGQRITHPWENLLLPWLHSQKEPFLLSTAYVEGAGQINAEGKQYDLRILANILRYHGYDNTVRKNGQRMWTKQIFSP